MPQAIERQGDAGPGVSPRTSHVTAISRSARFLLGTVPKASAGALMIAALAINFANVIGRYLFAHPFAWAEEVLVFMIVWAIFLGVGAVSFTRSHIAVDLVSTMLPDRQRRWLQWITATLTVLVCCYIAYQSTIIVMLMNRLGQVSMTAKVPMVVPYSAFAFGFLLIAVSTVAGMLIDGKDARGSDDKPDQEKQRES